MQTPPDDVALISQVIETLQQFANGNFSHEHKSQSEHDAYLATLLNQIHRMCTQLMIRLSLSVVLHCRHMTT